MSRILDHTTYDGPRWGYGCLHGRARTLFGLPDGAIAGSQRDDERFVGGTVDYPRELTAEEVWRFDLEPLGRDELGEAVSRAHAEARELERVMAEYDATLPTTEEEARAYLAGLPRKTIS